MKALSLSQPWAWVVVYGGKRVENRRWAPPMAMIGQRFAIHAARSWDQDAYDDLVDEEFGPVPGLPPKGELLAGRWLGRDSYTFGAIVGTAILRDYIDATSYGVLDVDTHPGCPDDQRRFFFGPYGFLLDDVQPVEPAIPARGMLNFWEVSAEILDQLARSP